MSTREFPDMRRRSIPVEPCTPGLHDNPELRVSGLGSVHSQPEDSAGRGRACRDESANTWQKDSGLDPVRTVSAVLQALDYLGIGWIACNASGGILGMNRTAEHIIKSRDGLALNSDGELCTTQGGNEALAEAVRWPAGEGIRRTSGCQDTALVLRRSSGKRPLTLLVRSVKQIPTGSVTLMLILDPSLPFRTTEVDLSQLYSLTPRESRLAILLMEGGALKDCCCTLGISLSTGRAHLRRIFRKTRVHCQGELVSVLIKTIGLTRLGSLGVSLG